MFVRFECDCYDRNFFWVLLADIGIEFVEPH